MEEIHSTFALEIEFRLLPHGANYYILNTDSLQIVYFAHFHSIVKDGKIFWGNQYDVNKMFVFKRGFLE